MAASLSLSPIFTSDSQLSDYSDDATPVAHHEKATPTDGDGDGDGDGALEQDVEKDLGDTKPDDPDLVSDFTPLSPDV